MESASSRIVRLTGLTILGAALALGIACAKPAYQEEALPAKSPSQTSTASPAETPAPTQTPAPTPFSIAWMSDTQLYTSSFPGVLPAMMQWVTDHREEENIRCLLHSGDILQAAYNTVQTERLAQAVSLLPEDLLCVTAGGNHDRAMPPALFKYFQQYRFDTRIDPAQSIFDGESYYTTFTAGNMKILVLSISYQREKDSVDWANQVLREHPDHYGILLVHSYLDPLMDQYNDGYTSSGDTLRDRVVKESPNLRLVLCGHMHGVCYRTLEADDDGDGVSERTVHEMMFNPQENEEGGGGYLRLLTFYPDRDEIQVISYSPYLDVYGIPEDPFGKSYTLTHCGLGSFITGAEE